MNFPAQHGVFLDPVYLHMVFGAIRIDGDPMTKEPQWNSGADTGVPPEDSSTYDNIDANEDAYDDVGTASNWYDSGYGHGYQDGYEAAIRDTDGSAPDATAMMTLLKMTAVLIAALPMKIPLMKTLIKMMNILSTIDLLWL